MRTLSSSACLTAAVAAVVLAAPAASASGHGHHGDNGTVKIHDAKTGQWLRKNEPHVCSFYLDGFFFDGRQAIDYKIVEMPPTGTKGKVAEVGNLTLDGQGHGKTDTLHVADGHYKLIWNFDGEHGKAKHKVFWVDCAGRSDDDNPAPGTSTSASPSTGTDETRPSSSAPSSPAADESSAAAAPSSAPSPNGGSEDLAETGASAPMGAIAGAAALLLGAGAYLTLRRRNSRARQH
jgi:LPXTG-motif cell wall-anchored protein